MKKEVITKSEKETRRIGAFLGERILDIEKRIFFALEGGLGAGKTTFLQGMALGMGVTEDVTSPTFLIFKRYDTKKERVFYHFDSFRVKEIDLLELGFEKIIENNRNIIAMEWSENVKNIVPHNAIKINFSLLAPKERKLIIKDDSGIITDVLRRI